MEIINRLNELQEVSRKIMDGPQSISFAQLLKRSRKVQAFLKASGVTAGNVVATATGDEIELFTIFVACLGSGIPLLPIDFRSKQSEAVEIIRRSKVEGIFIDQEILDAWFANSSIEDLGVQVCESL